jgi:hypothetical protein
MSGADNSQILHSVEGQVLRLADGPYRETRLGVTNPDS